MGWPTQIAEGRIREAIERGRFNDSPLKGTKLVFKMLSNEDWQVYGQKLRGKLA